LVVFSTHAEGEAGQAAGEPAGGTGSTGSTGGTCGTGITGSTCSTANSTVCFSKECADYDSGRGSWLPTSSSHSSKL
jgi:hypothetical protein